MKYEFKPKLLLVITAETREEQVLINLLSEMQAHMAGNTIHNAGMTYEEGRRQSITVEFSSPK